MISTALAAGFDIVAGVTALAIVGASLSPRIGLGPAHVFASLAFGIGFVFLVVGRGELFTENFLVPIAGLDHRRGSSWLNLGKLWVTSPLFNVLGGLVMILLLTTHGVFNHVIVVTLELIFGYCFGAHLASTFILGNFFLAAAGNMLGGLGLVTLNRLTQGRVGERKRASA